MKSSLLHTESSRFQNIRADGKYGIGLEYDIWMKEKRNVSIFADYNSYTYSRSFSTFIGSSHRSFETNVLSIGLLLDRKIEKFSNQKFQLSTNMSLGFNIPIGFSGRSGGSFLGEGSSTETTNVYSEIFPVRIAAGVKFKFPGIAFHNILLRPQIFSNLDILTLGIGKGKYIANLLSGISFVFEKNEI